MNPSTEVIRSNARQSEQGKGEEHQQQVQEIEYVAISIKPTPEMQRYIRVKDMLYI